MFLFQAQNAKPGAAASKDKGKAGGKKEKDPGATAGKGGQPGAITDVAAVEALDDATDGGATGGSFSAPEDHILETLIKQVRL